MCAFSKGSACLHLVFQIFFLIIYLFLQQRSLGCDTSAQLCSSEAPQGAAHLLFFCALIIFLGPEEKMSKDVGVIGYAI